MRGVAQVTAHHVDELRILLRGPDRSGMADRPNDEAWDPEPKPKADRGGQRAIGDRDRARSPAKQDWIGQRPMDGRVESPTVS